MSLRAIGEGHISSIEFRTGVLSPLGEISAEKVTRFVNPPEIVTNPTYEKASFLVKLHEMGFRMSIDDFGTGYSSLSYLRRFPIGKIKIDQSFVRDVTNDEGAASVVTAIIGLARSLKLEAIAEGVETKEQLELLRQKGCDKAQGFLFSRALAPDEFEKLVLGWKPK